MSSTTPTAPLFVLALALLAAAPARGACGDHLGLPPDALGQRARAFFTAVCEPDPAAHRAFVMDALAPELVERMGAEALVGMLARLHDDLGAVSLLAVRLTGPYEGAFDARHPDGGPALRVTLTLDEAPPHRIAGFGVEPADGAGLTFGSLQAAWGHLDAQAAAGAFAGVVLVARGGEPPVTRAYGWADRAGGVRNTPETRFNIASLSKLVTGAAVLQLAEAGRLDLDAPLGAYLDGFADSIATRVTLRHLLRHRSGWGDYFGTPAFEERLARPGGLQTQDDYLAFIRETPLDFAPGARWQYSNVGYEVLGGVIEAVTGRPYAAHVREAVLAPAGMADSGADWRAAGTATPYLGAYDRPAADGPVPMGTAAGAGYATAGDLLRFYRALAEGRLLGPEMTRLFWADYDAGAPTPPRYGRAGGAPGISSLLLADFEDDHVVIVLSNLYGPDVEGLGPALSRMLAR